MSEMIASKETQEPVEPMVPIQDPGSSVRCLVGSAQ